MLDIVLCWVHTRYNQVSELLLHNLITSLCKYKGFLRFFPERGLYPTPVFITLHSNSLHEKGRIWSYLTVVNLCLISRLLDVCLKT